MEKFKFDILNLHKMLFIYNAVLNGWVVRKTSDNNFEFKKSKNVVKKEIYLDNYVQNFVKENLNIDHIRTNIK